MSQEEQLDFISAVKCLQSTSGQTFNKFAGVKTRYDDFAALHISQGYFLPLEIPVFDPEYELEDELQVIDASLKKQS
ncbi:hypothetical protein K449DRAFT_427888 [Hypoxylon sp. EC38]|nr:hypothetical protein K449DRAFT_427888 [Hypoxylon sp. EC38]